VGAALPLGWVATAHPFRAAGPMAVPGPDLDRVFVRPEGGRGGSGEAGGHPAACRTNRTSMQTDPTACHSPIGSFQRRCCVVNTAAATDPDAAEHGAPSVAARQQATSQDVSSHPAAGDGARSWAAATGDLAYAQADALDLGVLAVAARQPPPAGVTHGRAFERGGVASLDPRLTAKSTGILRAASPAVQGGVSGSGPECAAGGGRP
jgi:hypothetical protein